MGVGVFGVLALIFASVSDLGTFRTYKGDMDLSDIVPQKKTNHWFKGKFTLKIEFISTLLLTKQIIFLCSKILRTNLINIVSFMSHWNPKQIGSSIKENSKIASIPIFLH